MKKHTEDNVLQSLARKRDLRINGTEIQILTGKKGGDNKYHDLGNGSWGKIDYLLKYKGYRKALVNKFQ